LHQNEHTFAICIYKKTERREGKKQGRKEGSMEGRKHGRKEGGIVGIGLALVLQNL